MCSAHWHSHVRPVTVHTRTVGVRIGLTCVLHPSEGKDHAASSRSCRGTQGQLPWRTYAQRAGDRMLAASRLFERTWRTTLLEAVVRISQVSGCIPDRYQAATARSAQAGVISPIELRNEQTGRNLTFGCWKYGIPSGLLDPLQGWHPTRDHKTKERLTLAYLGFCWGACCMLKNG